MVGGVPVHTIELYGQAATEEQHHTTIHIMIYPGYIVLRSKAVLCMAKKNGPRSLRFGDISGSAGYKKASRTNIRLVCRCWISSHV